MIHSDHLYRVMFRGLYTTKTIQITKLSKARNYYIGIVWEEIKKSNKSQQEWLKNSQAAKIRRGCEISQPLRNWSGVPYFFSICFSFCLLPSGSVALCSNLFLHARAGSLSSIHKACETTKIAIKFCQKHC